MCVFLMQALIAVKFPLRAAFIVSHRSGVFYFQVYFHAVLGTFLISLLISPTIHSSFNRMLFSLHEFIHILYFLFLLISSFIPLRSDRIQEIISLFLCLLRLSLCPKIWPILEKKFVSLLRMFLQYLGEQLWSCLVHPFDL